MSFTPTVKVTLFYFQSWGKHSLPLNAGCKMTLMISATNNYIQSVDWLWNTDFVPEPSGLSFQLFYFFCAAFLKNKTTKKHYLAWWKACRVLSILDIPKKTKTVHQVKLVDFEKAKWSWTRLAHGWGTNRKNHLQQVQNGAKLLCTFIHFACI